MAPPGVQVKADLEEISKLGYCSLASIPGKPFSLRGYILGPPASPFEGQKLWLEVEVPLNFQKGKFPPVFKFKGNLYHPIAYSYGKWTLVPEIGGEGQIRVKSLFEWKGTETLTPVVTEIYEQLKTLPGGSETWLWNCLFAKHCSGHPDEYSRLARESAIALNNMGDE